MSDGQPQVASDGRPLVDSATGKPLVTGVADTCCSCTACRDTCATVQITVSGFEGQPENNVCSNLYDGTWTLSLTSTGCPTDGTWAANVGTDYGGNQYIIGLTTTVPNTLRVSFSNIGWDVPCGTIDFAMDACCCPIVGTYIGTLGGLTITVIVS